MPPQYSAINHGRFCQLMAELCLSPDDAAVLLNVNASTVKRWYNGKESVPTQRIEELESIRGRCLQLVKYYLPLFTVEPKPRPYALVIYTNQDDMDQFEPQETDFYMPYKTHNWMMFRQADALKQPPYELQTYLIPFQLESFRQWLTRDKLSNQTAQHWAQSVLDKELSQ